MPFAVAVATALPDSGIPVVRFVVAVDNALATAARLMLLDKLPVALAESVALPARLMLLDSVPVAVAASTAFSPIVMLVVNTPVAVSTTPALPDMAAPMLPKTHDCITSLVTSLLPRENNAVFIRDSPNEFLYPHTL